MDQRIGLLAVDLATYTPDIDVDDVRRRIEMKIPDVLQQHCPGYGAAFVAHQVLQKLEFPMQQGNVLAAAAYGPRYQLDREIAETEDGLLGNDVAASPQRLDTRQQFDKGKRLDEVVVAAGAQAADAIVDLPERTDDQDGRGDTVVAQLAHDRDAVDVRKHAVDRDDRIVAGGAAVQRLVAVGRQVHLVTAGRERIHELAGGFRVILDDQNTAMASCHGLQSPNGRPAANWASACARNQRKESTQLRSKGCAKRPARVTSGCFSRKPHRRVGACRQFPTRQMSVQRSVRSPEHTLSIVPVSAASVIAVAAADIYPSHAI